MRLKSKTVSILSKRFSLKSQRRCYQILSNIVGMCGNRSTPALETVTVRKKKFDLPLPPAPRFDPGPFQIFRRSNLPWQYCYFIFSP